MVVEETLVDGDTEVPEVDHLGGLNIDVADIDLALTLSLTLVLHITMCMRV